MIHRKSSESVGGGGAASGLFGHPGLSLVEQKKRQWALEKEENARLVGASLHATNDNRTQSQFLAQRSSIRTYYSQSDLSASESASQSVSALQVFPAANAAAPRTVDDCYGREPNVGGQLVDGRVRSPSLPPIARLSRNNHAELYARRTQYNNNNTATEDETSGYISDHTVANAQDPSCDMWPKQSPTTPRRRLVGRLPLRLTTQVDHHLELGRRRLPRARMRSPRSTITDATDLDERDTDFSVANSYETPTSSSSGSSEHGAHRGREERAKWGDRGVTVGHFYDPLSGPGVAGGRGGGSDEMSSVTSGRLGSIVGDGTIGMVDGPGWLSHGVQQGRADIGVESVMSYSFIRGQNAPIDAKTLSERATRRLRALEFQTAIKEQLAERERCRQTERDQRADEERRHEELVQLQQQAERHAFEAQLREQRLQHEAKQRQQAALRTALQRAEEEARCERERRRRQRGVLTAAAAEQLHHTEAAVATSADDKSREPNGQSPTNTTESAAENCDQFLIGSPIKLRPNDVSKPLIPFRAPAVDQPIGGTPVGATLLTGTAMMPAYVTLPLPLVAIQSNPTMALATTQPATASPYLSQLQFAVMFAHQMEQFVAPPNLFVKPTDCDGHSSPSVPCAPTAAAPASSPPSDGGQSRRPATTPPPCSDQPELAVEATESESTALGPTEATASLEVQTRLPHDATFTRESAASAVVAAAPRATVDRATQTERQRRTTCATCDHQPNQVGGLAAAAASAAANSQQPDADAAAAAAASGSSADADDTDLAAVATVATAVAHSTTPAADLGGEVSGEVVLAEDTTRITTTTTTKTTTTTTTTTTTLLQMRSREFAAIAAAATALSGRQLAERPRWGVNRPPQQYVKATDRDPFSLRHRHRHRPTLRPPPLLLAQLQLHPPRMGAATAAALTVTDGGSEAQSDSASATATTTPVRIARPLAASSSQHSGSSSPNGTGSPVRSRCGRSAALHRLLPAACNDYRSAQAIRGAAADGAHSTASTDSDGQRDSSSASRDSRSTLPVALRQMSRSICTEIVPIRTDRNGQIYVNYADSAVLLAERFASGVQQPKQQQQQHLGGGGRPRRPKRMLERRIAEAARLAQQSPEVERHAD